MRRLLRGAIAASAAFSLIAIGCSSVSDHPRETTGVANQALLNGVSANGGDTGTAAIFLNAWTRVCSGTLLTPQWLITAKSCVPAGASDTWVDLDDNNQGPPNRVVYHPTLNLALVQLKTPFTTSFSARTIFNGSHKALLGKQVTAYGAGNAHTRDATPDPGDLGLRQGTFTVSAPTDDGYVLSGVAPATGGSAPDFVAGDEGGGTLYIDPQFGPSLAGVHVVDSNNVFHDVSAELFHDWAIETIYGTQTYVDGFSRDDQGNIPSNTKSTNTWSPCGDGGYVWSASFNLAPTATASITSGGTTTVLNPVTASHGHGIGPMTIEVDTAADATVGITELTAKCDKVTVACVGTECIDTAAATPNQDAHTQWQPCGDACFTWGATLNQPAGDSITVDGKAPVNATAFAGTACGSVDVHVVHGAQTSSRTMDVWAQCGANQCSGASTWMPPRSQIYAAHDGLCFDDWAWSSSPGNGIVQWSCEDITQGHFNQIWELNPTDHGWAQIRNAWSKLCLEVPNASTANGVQLIQNTCSASPAQQFLVERVVGQENQFHLHPRHSSKCVRVAGGSSAGQAAIVQDDCSDDLSTVFSFNQPGGGSCRPNDFCANNNGSCAQNATCAPSSPAGGTCACAPGNLVSGDINEPSGICYPNKCGVNNGSCSANATCTNDVHGGNVTCQCKPGYYGDGYSCIVDNCTAALQPAAHASCVVDPGGTSRSWACNGGYFPYVLSTPIVCMDKCSSLLRPQFCPNATYTCTTHENSIDCTPPPPNPCVTNPCPSGYACTPQGKTRTCTRIIQHCGAGMIACGNGRCVRFAQLCDPGGD